MKTCSNCQENMITKRFGKLGHVIEHRGRLITISKIDVCDGCGSYIYYK